MSLIRKFFHLSLLLALPSCCSVNVMLPAPIFSHDFPPKGPPNYEQGLIDGCKSGMAAGGRAVTSLIYDKLYYDVEKALLDKVYYKAWRDGYNYCRYEGDPGIAN